MREKESQRERERDGGKRCSPETRMRPIAVKYAVTPNTLHPGEGKQDRRVQTGGKRGKTERNKERVGRTEKMVWTKVKEK